MAFLGGNMLLPELDFKVCFAGITGILCFAIGLSRAVASKRFSLKAKDDEAPNLAKSLLVFAYSCFLKPHGADNNGSQQNALESFYKTQAGVYDSTRGVLLKGREDMLALVAAQLQTKAVVSEGKKTKRIWVDVGHCSDTPSSLSHG